ncbi:MAG TPA: hypothetical protein VHZ30_00110 [Verrucomicrobiae bacterium]|nr:hypothetical protein [Verrucomicrobiae bacterium]
MGGAYRKEGSNRKKVETNEKAEDSFRYLPPQGLGTIKRYASRPREM